MFLRNEHNLFAGDLSKDFFQSRTGKILFIGVFFALIMGAYLLPHVFPSSIGTGYIILSLVMSGLSGLAWQSKIMSPRQALYLAIIGCVCLMPLMPYTSNDTQRYLWDGAVFMSGLDPYVTAPNDPLVANLRAIWATPEEHAAYATLYPPGALSLFGVSSLAGPNHAIWVWKLLTTLAVIFTLIASFKLLVFRGLTQYFYLVAFCPLLLFESQIGGHIDIFSGLGIVLALWALDKDKVIWAGIIIGLAATIKFLPAVVVGPLLFSLARRKALSLFVSSTLTWLGIYALMFGLGYEPLGILPTFFEKWRGGAPFYPILEAVNNGLGLSNSMFLNILIGLAVAGFSVSAWLARRGQTTLAIALCLSVPLLLSPVLFPWYLVVFVPFLALRPSVTMFLAVTLVPFNYVVLNKWLAQGIWDQPVWPSALLGSAIIIGLSLDVWGTRKLRKN